MPYATSAGAKVHFVDSGGDGPAIVFGHAFFMDHEMFARQTEALAPKYRVISIDARAHGRTEQPGGAFSHWDLARDAWTVLDDLGIEQVVAGGTGQGGFTALRMALLWPPRVRGLLLLGTSAEAFSDVQRVGYRQVLDAWMGTSPLAGIAKMVAGLVIGDRRAEHRPWLDKWLNSDRSRIAAAADCLINVDSIAELIGDISCPAILLRGAFDTAFGAEVMHSLATGLGGPAELHTIDGAAHAIGVTHAPEVNKLLLEFLERLER